MAVTFRDSTVVITGGASGIGAAMAVAAFGQGARVAILDQRIEGSVLPDGCMGLSCDVTDETSLNGCLSEVAGQLGPIDICVSNAGLFEGQGDHAASATDEVWMRNWSVHVMAHVHAARALLPGMLSRGSGCFVNVASAAGLLNQIGDAAYSASKHAAVSFAESLAISHGEEGIHVSVVCPRYVATPLIGLDARDSEEGGPVLTAEQVARAIINGVEAGRFRILPHPEVADHVLRRAQDHDGWISGMQRLRAKAVAQLGPDDHAALYRLD